VIINEEKKICSESNLMEHSDCFREVKTRAWNNSAMEWRVNPKEAGKKSEKKIMIKSGEIKIE